MLGFTSVTLTSHILTEKYTHPTEVAISLFYLHTRNEKLTLAGSCNCDWVDMQSKCWSILASV